MKKTKARQRREIIERRLEKDEDHSRHYGTTLVLEPKAERTSQNDEHLIQELITDEYEPNARTAKWTVEAALAHRKQRRWGPARSDLQTPILARIARLGLALNTDDTVPVTSAARSSPTRVPTAPEQWQWANTPEQFLRMPGRQSNPIVPALSSEVLTLDSRTLVLAHEPLRHPILEPSGRIEIQQVWLTFLTDLHTGLIAGYQIGCEKEAHGAILRAIAMAILPKEQLLARLGQGTDWPIWGRPAQLLIPQLASRSSETVTETCLKNGITVQAVSECGFDTENLIDRRNRDLTAHLTHQGIPHWGPAAKDAENEGDRPDPQPAKHPEPAANLVLVMEDLQQAVARAVCDGYNRQHDPGNEASRLEQWKQAVTGGPNHAGMGLPEKPGFDDIAGLLPKLVRKIGPQPVKQNNLYYDSSALHARREATLWEEATPRDVVEVIEDPLDLTTIRMKQDGHWITLQCTCELEGPRDKWSRRAMQKTVYAED